MIQLDDNISEHFKYKELFTPEFLSKCNLKGWKPSWFIDSELIVLLEIIRNKFDSPVHINYMGLTQRGFRDFHTPIKEGAEYSQHYYGRAADITVEGVREIVVAKYVQGQFGYYTKVYRSWTHVDVRWEKL